MPRVLFVCTGNICRSPMAEGIFRQLVASKGLADTWDCSSAGTLLDFPPTPASENSVLVMAEQGIDITRHISRPVNLAILEDASLILTMAAEHVQFLQEVAPHLGDRVHRLSEIAGVALDVEDPIGMDLSAYRLAAAEIRYYLEQGFNHLLHLVEAQETARQQSPASPAEA